VIDKLSEPHTRRTLLSTAGAGLAAAALAACGSSSSSGGGSGSSGSATAGAAGTATAGGSGAPAAGSLKGTIQFSTYPDWIGKHTIADFEKANPGVKVSSDTDESDFASLLPKIKAQPGIFSMALASTYEIQRAILLGVVQELDFSKMPNTKYIAHKYLSTPVNAKGNYFVPTDYGKYGIAVRSDLVSEPITSWKDLFALSSKYSGKVFWYDFPKDIITVGLLKLGYPANDADQSHIEAAGAAMTKLKPTMGQLGTNGIGAALLNGSAAISVTYDYDAYAAAKKNPHIKWIIPSEGVPAYLEGWLALKGGPTEATQAFMNYALEPKRYASFLDLTDAAGVMPSANRYLPKSLTSSDILFPSSAELKRVFFLNFVGQAEAYYDTAYTKFKAS
jgi:spermidine/putrescine transport system substrate-binding protein